MTKKQKAELAIQYPEVRAWVLNYIMELTDGKVHHLNPTDLFNTTPTVSHFNTTPTLSWPIVIPFYLKGIYFQPRLLNFKYKLHLTINNLLLKLS